MQAYNSPTRIPQKYKAPTPNQLIETAAQRPKSSSLVFRASRRPLTTTRNRHTPFSSTYFPSGSHPSLLLPHPSYTDVHENFVTYPSWRLPFDTALAVRPGNCNHPFPTALLHVLQSYKLAHPNLNPSTMTLTLPRVLAPNDTPPVSRFHHSISRYRLHRGTYLRCIRLESPLTLTTSNTLTNHGIPMLRPTWMEPDLVASHKHPKPSPVPVANLHQPRDSYAQYLTNHLFRGSSSVQLEKPSGSHSQQWYLHPSSPSLANLDQLQTNLANLTQLDNDVSSFTYPEHS